MPLTQKQSYYLLIIENARTQGKSIRAAALDHDLNPVNLYAAVNQLRKIGALDKSTSKAKSGFVALNIEPVRGDKIELKRICRMGSLFGLAVRRISCQPCCEH